MLTEVASLNLNDDKLNLKEAQYLILEEYLVRVLLVKLGETFLVWVGRDGMEKTLTSLSIAIAGTASTILGSDADLTEQNLAKKLSKRFNNRPVYVSYNVSASGGAEAKKYQLAVEEKVLHFLTENL